MESMNRGLGSIAYWAVVAALAIVVTEYSGPRQDIQVLTYAVIALAALLIQWISKTTIEKKDRTKAEHENLQFTLSMMWSIMRRSLVSDHDRYVYQYGAINDTQRTIWESDYEAYEKLCKKIGKKNGVMDSYREDILNLPSTMGKPKGTSNV